jgi:proteic killer suppression protein
MVSSYIAVKLQTWVNDIEIQGLEEVRKVPRWHDEPLHGKSKDQRSIRLSKS